MGAELESIWIRKSDWIQPLKLPSRLKEREREREREKERERAKKEREKEKNNQEKKRRRRREVRFVPNELESFPGLRFH